MALHATTIRFADRAYMAIARAADAQGISVSQYVREAALIRAVLDELDSAEEAIHSAHDLLAIAREVRRLAEVDPPGPPRANAGRRRSNSATLRAGRLATEAATRPTRKANGPPSTASAIHRVAKVLTRRHWVAVVSP